VAPSSEGLLSVASTLDDYVHNCSEFEQWIPKRKFGTKMKNVKYC
jgi:hypothetical protein